MVSSVAGVGVDRGHEPTGNPHRVLQHLGHRREAVGGAGGVRHHQIVGGERIVVHAEHDGLVGTACRRRDQNPLRAVFEVECGLVARGEDAGAFQRDIDIAPRQFLGVADRGHLDRAAAHVDGVAVHRDGAGKTPVHRVVADEVGVGFHRPEIVDRDHLDIGAAGFDDGTQHIAADTAEAVDSYLDSHVTSWDVRQVIWRRPRQPLP
jgi:hypothetical protein